MIKFTFHDELSAAGGTEKELMGEEVVRLAMRR